LRNASQRGARTIKDSDLLQIIHTTEALEFLRLDFPKKQLEKADKPKARSSTGSAGAAASSASTGSKASGATAAARPAGVKAITNFFATSKPSAGTPEQSMVTVTAAVVTEGVGSEPTIKDNEGVAESSGAADASDQPPDEVTDMAVQE
jgi:hypothetical protein